MTTTIQTTPLPTTLEEAYRYARLNRRIVPWAKYGEHIPLQCKNHSHLRWWTRNIGGIEARNVFFDLMDECGGERECDCLGTDLELVVPDDWQQKIVPLRIVNCDCCGEPICEETVHFSWGSCHECFDAHCWFRGEGKCLAGKK